MYLHQLDIVGFRGIRRLSIKLRPNMVLIGENAWGKSSLLAALSLILNAENRLYRFHNEDFYLAEQPSDLNGNITLLFTFSERDVNDDKAKINRRYKSLFVPHEDGLERIYLRVTGERQSMGILTEYLFLNEKGEPIVLEDTETLALALIARHPVYRFRDARLNTSKLPSAAIYQEPQEDETILELQAVEQLLQYYFVDRQGQHYLAQDASLLWERVKSLCGKLQKDEDKQLQKRLVDSITSLFVNQVPQLPGKQFQPILLLEDLAERLHPRIASIVWELSNYLPIQRILTTNSVELLSQADLRSICRLVRYTERIKAYQLSRHDLGKEDLRRLTFHIHHNRSLALFSRTWLLVEGETEVWVLSELARLLGINLAMEGIRIVEFAQSGLRPLIKYAKAMGIEWYVLTDGDEAGRKYAETVKLMLEDGESPSHRLTVLPRMDIEHFFYTEGFEDVFIRLAHWQVQNNYLPMRKIIQRAIQRTSKPDLAIAISYEVERRGSQSIPLLFKRLFSKVLNLTRIQY